MRPHPYIALAALVLLLLVSFSGCSGPARESIPVVYILYGSEKGDLSYTDAAYRGILAAQQEMAFEVREFTPANIAELPEVLGNATGNDRPGLIISVGFQYAELNRRLAQDNPDVRFLAIDQSGIGTGNIQAYEITSYGDSYLSGVLAASATRTGRVGIIMGMQTELLDTFIKGYTDGAHAVNSSVIVESAYVRRNSTDGFTDPAGAGRIAEGMFRNETDVIFIGAGYSNTGAFEAANRTGGRYIIGTDSDQSPLGPGFILASAVKRVDRVVYSGIRDYMKGSFTGGNRVAGLREGATGIVFNPRFASYNGTVSTWESRAEAGEEAYLASRAPITEK